LEALVIAYKFLRSDGTGAFTGFRWPLPDGGPGSWVEADPGPCQSGVHACRVSDLPLWLGRTLYAIELDGTIVEEPSKVVAPRGRLLRRIDAWDDDLRATYTRMCADRAHALAREADVADWDAVVEPSVPEGPALLGFVAARIAEAISGPDAYAAERARQAGWLAERLGLDASA
jgi:hypothetical protein